MAGAPGAVHSASASAPTERGKLRIFISYSRDDLNFADQLETALRFHRYEVALDRHGISGGEDWKRRLGTLIRDAETVIFVLSPSSAQSPICKWEVEEAARLGKRIIPVPCLPVEVQHRRTNWRISTISCSILSLSRRGRASGPASCD
jgi:hypothetical protein